MRIAQVAPLFESVPPKYYGGTERVVSYLTEELVRQGHEVPLSKEFRDMPLISISNDQRKPFHWANWQATVYHGVPADRYRFREQAGSYLAFLGRISPEKRVDRAIEIAKRVSMRVKIAAKVDRVDRDYFESVVRPLL